MLKKSLMILGLCGLLSAGDFTIDIKKDKWNLVGVNTNIDISSLNIIDDETLWIYKKGWYAYSLNNQDMLTNAGIETPNDTIDMNSGFWINAKDDRNISINDNCTWTEPVDIGWNLYSFNDDINLSALDSSKIHTLWGYDDGWKVWGLSDELLQSTGLEKLQTIESGKGYWINAKSAHTPGGIVSFGNELNITNGTFETIAMNSSDCVEDIWNISFPIDTSKDFSDFDIVVDFTKYEYDGEDGAFDPDTGKFIFEGVSLSQGVLSVPSKLTIVGNGDSGSGSKSFISDDIEVQNSIALLDGKIILKLGYLMKIQTFVSQSSFKAKTNYDLNITFSQDISSNINGTVEIK